MDTERRRDHTDGERRNVDDRRLVSYGEDATTTDVSGVSSSCWLVPRRQTSPRVSEEERASRKIWAYRPETPRDLRARRINRRRERRKRTEQKKKPTFPLRLPAASAGAPCAAMSPLFNSGFVSSVIVPPAPDDCRCPVVIAHDDNYGIAITYAVPTTRPRPSSTAGAIGGCVARL